MKLVEIIKALSHENRLRMLNLLRKQPLCVCELRNIMNINQSNASRHLIKLKNAGLVNYKKEGQWVYYQLNQKQIKNYNFINNLLTEELKEHDYFIKDINKLKSYNESKITCENLDEADIF